MKVNLSMFDQEVCVFDIWEDKVPGIAAALEKLLPISSIAQHGKIVGDLLFFSVPLVLPPENSQPLQDICRQRRQENGSASGAVCFYNPRQQICIYYGDDLADEPFDISYIGEIVDHEKAMQLAAIRCWTSSGAVITMAQAD